MTSPVFRARSGVSRVSSLFVGTWLARWRQWRDRVALRGQRADYFEHLANLTEALQGRKTLLDVFGDEARRHTLGTPRGRQAQRWQDRFEHQGGDLALTWRGTFAESELALVRAGQAAGESALRHTLRALAEQARLVARIRADFFVQCAAAGVAVCVCTGMLAATAYFTVPRLASVFAAVPSTAYGPWTHALFALAQTLRRVLPVALVALTVAVAWVAWSLPCQVGRLRGWLDRRFPWNLYRHLQASSLFAVLHILIGPEVGSDTRLREALLVLLGSGGPAWRAWHIRRQLDQLEQGCVGAETFDTGLLDAPLQWLMVDVYAARGLPVALRVVRDRLREHLLVQALRQAQAMRWALLGTGVACGLGLLLWHYAVIDEMRRAMMLLFSGG